MATHLRNLKLSELSLVDEPANKGARVTLFKRDDAEPYWKRDFSQAERDAAASSGAAMPDGSFPIKSTQDLKNAIHAIGRAKDPAAAKKHIISRARSLGASDLLPQDWVSKHAGNGNQGVDDMTTEELNKAIADAVTKATAELTKQTGDLKKALDAANAEIKKMGADNKKKPQADTTDDGEPDEDDATKKSAWHKWAEKRVAKALADQADVAKGDEVIKVGETEVRKSEVGEQTFTVLKAQAAEIAKERDARELSEFTKRAETETAHLPGEPIAKGKALRAVEKLGEEEKKTLLAMLKGGNAAMQTMLREKGMGGSSGSDSADEKLEALAKSYAETHKVTVAKANDAVLQTPEGKQLYQQSLAEGKERARAA